MKDIFWLISCKKVAVGGKGRGNMPELDWKMMYEIHKELGVVAHTFNPSTWEAEAGGCL